MPDLKFNDSDEMNNCTCCNRHRSEVAKLIASPKACICDICVYLCLDIIHTEHWGLEDE